jgi:hypothetical protein
VVHHSGKGSAREPIHFNWDVFASLGVKELFVRRRWTLMIIWWGEGSNDSLADGLAEAELVGGLCCNGLRKRD